MIDCDLAGRALVRYEGLQDDPVHTLFVGD